MHFAVLEIMENPQTSADCI